ncbi:hypothetical protein GUITHDRAFT_145237 [Guillardia theta CCMP2712]|uniref:Anaphase-promoting complex subunit 4 WD40 domain-containing protein n=1 Tax=Guillardia theta (strain CCMP2712) TaxID=905079 RepID=L1IML4_GUITC|nr:hypothetical protein GUITHDRAFT_145237 [Guillardia theta CCMP2712]EKX37134.1 hypothetical protein GUITHDRAFT_145237 [Guillardia theta CCMP2712]|eukprot:XP_005824114.1 hypothetical protein GUITHDRAFT_145237 [Guillardia theta CCMP2712]
MSDGLLFMACDTDIFVWDQVEDLAETVEVSSHINCCCSSSSGEITIIGCDDGQLYVWSAGQHENERSMVEGEGGAAGRTGEGSEEIAALSVGDGNLKVWEVLPHSKLIGGAVRLASFAPRLPEDHVLGPLSSQIFIVAWSTYKVNLWRTDDLNKPLLHVGQHELDVRVVRFIGDGLHVVTGSLDKSVRVWRIWTKATVAASSPQEPSFGRTTSIEASGDNPGGFGRTSSMLSSEGLTRLSSMISVSYDQLPDMIKIVRLQRLVRSLTGRLRSHCRFRKELQGSILDVDGCPQGRYIASASTDRTVCIFDLMHKFNPGAKVLEGSHAAYVQSVKFSFSGRLLASVGGDRFCRIWNVETCQPLHALKAEGALNHVAFSSEEDLVAVGGAFGTIHVWKVETGECLQNIPQSLIPAVAEISHVSWIPTKPILLVSSTIGEVWAWDLEANRIRLFYVNEAPLDTGRSEDPLVSSKRSDKAAPVELCGISCLTTSFRMVRSTEERRVRRQKSAMRVLQRWKQSTVARAWEAWRGGLKQNSSLSTQIEKLLAMESEHDDSDLCIFGDMQGRLRFLHMVNLLPKDGVLEDPNFMFARLTS